MLVIPLSMLVGVNHLVFDLVIGPYNYCLTISPNVTSVVQSLDYVIMLHSKFSLRRSFWNGSILNLILVLLTRT